MPKKRSVLKKNLAAPPAPKPAGPRPNVVAKVPRAVRADTNAKKSEKALRPQPQLTIVGIGASAGGLDAIERFLRHTPQGSGWAIVVVQHLDPTRKDLLPELLRASTPFKVVEIKNGTRVLPDFVYVIPPGKDLSIVGGVLRLSAPGAPRGRWLPIDSFFRALAEDQQERSVGVILSGMGADGTEGIKAIKQRAGVVLVQDPATAKFTDMPRSAVETKLADIVAPVDELPGLLLEHLQQAPLPNAAEGEEIPEAESSLRQVISVLRGNTGHDFSLYKRSTLQRRIQRRMGLHQIIKIEDYIRCLRENPQEVEFLFRELLIGVTSFFRDPANWDKLRDEVLPPLLEKGGAGIVLRAWVAGCSTGEEAYSLAIIFKEALERKHSKPPATLKIFATDLDNDAVARARQGLFPATIAEHVSPERLARFFVNEDGGYRIAKEIREMIVFAPHNIIMDPPFTRLDILSCRNLLIYFTPELQKKLLPLFYYSIKPGGTLFLGSAETIGGFSKLFEPSEGSSRIFRRREPVPVAGLVDFPSSYVANKPESALAVSGPVSVTDTLQASAEHWLLKHHGPSAVLVNNQGDILYLGGHTSRYLEPVAGKANWNVFAMVRESLRYELGAIFRKALAKEGAVSGRACKIEAGDTSYFVKPTVQAITAKGVLAGLVMIVFTEVVDPALIGKGRTSKAGLINERVRSLTQELMLAREEVQSTREAMLTSQEELKSANEELQSTNEELQSTNEELTTAKEEMQSLNEELQTVNAELQAKLDELSSAGNDMKNLLNSTEIATLFLDHSLHVRCFTPHATKLMNLIPGDVGRPVTDLACNQLYPELAVDAAEVLRSLVPVEKALTTRDGRWFALRVMPYRTMDNRIEGVVITFTDMTIVRKLAAESHFKPTPPAAN